MFPDPDFVKIRVKLDWTPPSPMQILKVLPRLFNLGNGFHCSYKIITEVKRSRLQFES